MFKPTAKKKVTVFVVPVRPIQSACKARLLHLNRPAAEVVPLSFPTITVQSLPTQIGNLHFLHISSHHSRSGARGGMKFKMQFTQNDGT